jgi:hypothetical protein
MLIGIRAMQRLATFFKTAALASVTAVAATAATAQDFTVQVYETGYFPNVVYTDEASRITFVNNTTRDVGIDTDPYGYILIRRISSGSSATVDISTIDGRTVRIPYLYGYGRNDGETFQIVEGSAPDS